MFKGCTVIVQVATLIINNPRENPVLCYVHTLKVCHYAVHYVSVMDGKFQTSTVNIHSHTLNLNNQYPTLLKVYKPAA